MRRRLEDRILIRARIATTSPDYVGHPIPYTSSLLPATPDFGVDATGDRGSCTALAHA